VERHMRAMVLELYLNCHSCHPSKVLPHLPHDPVKIFSQDDINSIESVKQRIFYSYFAHDNMRLMADLDFEVESEFDFLIFGIYYMKNGPDQQVLEKLHYNPGLSVFTIKDFFVAIFAPHLPMKDIDELVFDDEKRIVHINNETFDVLSCAHMLHFSPFLRAVSYHIGSHSDELFEYV
jgi:hypothetical protein